MSLITQKNPSTVSDASVQCSEVIYRHSRSFSIASRMLPSRVRSSVHSLYAWCRSVDDSVDSAISQHEAELELRTLEDDLEKVSKGQSNTLHKASDWLKPLVADRLIDVTHAKELIEGMRMDLNGIKIETQADLHHYCYLAAGTVGLMLARLMGVKNLVAYRYAIALGVAMQMTNIARDVREDALRGRSYLPGIGEPMEAAPGLVRDEVKRLLGSAEAQYRVAEEGLKYLPSDCRFAILMALNLYREIGREIRRRDYQVLFGRTVISRTRLAWVLLRTTFIAMQETVCTAKVSLLSMLQEKKMMNESQLKPNSNNSTMSTAVQARHAVHLGLSLTLIMAAALFVLVYLNPKDASYSYLPLVYSGVSLAFAFMFNRLAARCESEAKA